jgi:hypothetical protein
MVLKLTLNFVIPVQLLMLVNKRGSDILIFLRLFLTCFILVFMVE